MKSNAECFGLRLVGLATVTSLLSACATAGFETGIVAVCPPVAEYSLEEQERAAEELAMLPDVSAVVEMMGDYVVLRDQARGCENTNPRLFSQ